MKCSKCNYELTGGTDLPEEDVKYCYNCGKKLTHDEPSPKTFLFKEDYMEDIQNQPPKYFINGHLCPAKLWRMLLRTETKLGPEMLTITKQPNDFSYKSGKYHFQKMYPKGGTKND